ncbi:hypothetical protein H9P43_004517 [Blastocladiella emersonii ATCC 22665]|nr:hypothetical protein H9P43_004517 [Blastocladiella emersonii ATCC 22665]
MNKSIAAATKVNRAAARASARPVSPVVERMMAAQKEAAAKAARSAPVPAPVPVETKPTLLGRIKACIKAGVRRIVPGRKQQQQQQQRDTAVAAAAKFAGKGRAKVSPVLPISRNLVDMSACAPAAAKTEIALVDSALVVSATLAAPSSPSSESGSSTLCVPTFLPQASLLSLGLANNTVNESSNADSVTATGTLFSAEDIKTVAGPAAVNQDRRDSGAGQELPTHHHDASAIPEPPSMPQQTVYEPPAVAAAAPVLKPFMHSTPYDPVAFNTSVTATIAALDKLVKKARILTAELVPSGMPSDLFLFHRYNGALRPACRSMRGKLLLSRPLALFRGVAPQELLEVTYDRCTGFEVRKSLQVTFTEQITAVAMALPQAHFATRLGVLDVVAARRPEYAAAALMLAFMFMHADGQLSSTVVALNQLWWSPGETSHFHEFHIGPLDSN